VLAVIQIEDFLEAQDLDLELAAVAVEQEQLAVLAVLEELVLVETVVPVTLGHIPLIHMLAVVEEAQILLQDPEDQVVVAMVLLELQTQHQVLLIPEAVVAEQVNLVLHMVVPVDMV
jgi:energy-coupling factor transporter ATP-binding protein EcfA2